MQAVARHAKYVHNHKLRANSVVTVVDEKGPGHYDDAVGCACDHADDDDAGDVQSGRDRWR